MQPGIAQTGQFQFSTATVCLAPMAQQKAINPAVHSIGLTKNVKVDASPNKVDLTQGISNDVVATVINNINLVASCEVYEFTPKNLAYGLSLDGSSLVTPAAPTPLKAAVAAAATTFTLDGDQTAAFPAGSWGYLQEDNGDYVHVFRVASSAVATGTTTVTFTGYPVPAGMAFSTAGRAGSYAKIDADPDQMNSYYAMRVIGTSIVDKRPITLHFPKVRITKGFSMAFSADNFGNLPFEFTPMAPIPNDVGYDPAFRNRMSVLV